MKWNRLTILIVVFLIFSDIASGQGCSQCKLVAEQSSELDDSSFASNINTGILYLMVIPYLLIMFLFRHKLIAFIKGKIQKEKARLTDGQGK